MQSNIPLPTDNIYKFYALFGLILFIFGFSSMIYINKSTNELVYKTVVSIEELKVIEEPTSVQELQPAALEERMEIALSDKKFFIICIGVLVVSAVFLMYYGFHNWHNKVQPLQDELAELTVKKLRQEMRKSLANKLLKRTQKNDLFWHVSDG